LVTGDGREFQIRKEELLCKLLAGTLFLNSLNFSRAPDFMQLKLHGFNGAALP